MEANGATPLGGVLDIAKSIIEDRRKKSPLKLIVQFVFCFQMEHSMIFNGKKN